MTAPAGQFADDKPFLPVCELSIIYRHIVKKTRGSDSGVRGSGETGWLGDCTVGRVGVYGSCRLSMGFIATLMVLSARSVAPGRKMGYQVVPVVVEVGIVGFCLNKFKYLKLLCSHAPSPG